MPVMCGKFPLHITVPRATYVHLVVVFETHLVGLIGRIDRGVRYDLSIRTMTDLPMVKNWVILPVYGDEVIPYQLSLKHCRVMRSVSQKR